MKITILAAKRRAAVERLAKAAVRLSGKPVDFSNLPKGNEEIRQLFMLERMADFLESLDVPSGIDIDELLKIDGLSKTSTRLIEAKFGS